MNTEYCVDHIKKWANENKEAATVIMFVVDKQQEEISNPIAMVSGYRLDLVVMMEDAIRQIPGFSEMIETARRNILLEKLKQ